MNKVVTQDLSALPVKDRLYRVPVEGVEGLFLQVTPAGVRSWVFRYRGVAKQGSVTIGRYPAMSLKEVRQRLKVLAGDVAAGRDPGKAEREVKAVAKLVASPAAPAPAAKGPKVETVRSVAEDFYVKHIMVNNQPSTQALQRWTLDAKVYPVLGNLPIDQVTPQVMSRFLDGLASTPSQQNRIRSLMSKLFRWAGRREECLEGKPNPVLGYEHARTTSREVRLSDADFAAVREVYWDMDKWTSVAAYQHRWAVMFLLMTGCRAGVIYNLKPEHMFPEEGLLRFPAREPGLKGCRAVYMGTAAREMLKRIKLGMRRDQLQRSWEVMRPEGCEVTLHDLRRTFASVAADLGHDEGVIDALLGHSRGAIRDAYVRRADTTLMAVAEEVSWHIARLLGIAHGRCPSCSSGS